MIEEYIIFEYFLSEISLRSGRRFYAQNADAMSIIGARRGRVEDALGADIRPPSRQNF